MDGLKALRVEVEAAQRAHESTVSVPTAAVSRLLSERGNVVALGARASRKADLVDAAADLQRAVSHLENAQTMTSLAALVQAVGRLVRVVEGLA